MVRPRLYGRGDIHNRELRRRRIKPIVGIVRHTFTESLALGNAGLSLYRETFPEKISRKFFGTGPPWGRRPSVRYRHLSTLPVKPSEIPVNRLSPSKGYNPSTEPQKALKSARFAGALLGHLHPTCTLTCSHSAQNTPFFNIFLTAFLIPLGISETKNAILQD